MTGWSPRISRRTCTARSASSTVGKPYYFRALSANGRELPSGTEIIVIYSEDSACFVESRERFFDVLFDEENPLEAPENQPEEQSNDIGRA